MAVWGAFGGEGYNRKSYRFVCRCSHLSDEQKCLFFRFPTHIIQRGRERLFIVPPCLEGSLPVYFCRYTSHYVAWSRTYNPRLFRQRL